MFNRQKTDPKVVVLQMSSLAIAWALLAGVAYLGLIKKGIDLIAAQTPWQGIETDSGLIALDAARVERLNATLGMIAQWAVIALPVMIVAALALGILVRARPRFARGGAAGIGAAGLLGLATTLLIFLAQVATRKNGTEFIVALVTIALVAVLLRLQRFVRRFYRRSPAFATLFFAVFTIVYLILANGVNISSIVMSQVDIWLGIVAFAIVVYAGFHMARAGRRAK